MFYVPQKFMVGLNFSDEQEADKFLKAMETKIEDRQQQTQSNISPYFWQTCYHSILALKQRKDNTFSRAGPSSPPGHPAPPLPSTAQPTPPRSSPLYHNCCHVDI